MYKLSKKSEDLLLECDERLVKICREVIKHFDFAVLVTYRGEVEQNKAFDEGKSKKRFPSSKHNTVPSMAIDIAPYPIDFNDTNSFFYLAGLMMATAKKFNVRLRWGGDFNMNNNFKDSQLVDLVHFELIE